METQGRRFGNGCGDGGFHVEERSEGELAGLAGTLAVGQGTAGGEHVEAQLQHVVLADGAHAALSLRHLVEFLGGLQVLAGDVHLFAGQQQTEIEADGLHGHLLRLCEEARLRLAVAQRLYAAVPLQVVHAEERLREGDGHGQRHELIARPAAARLVQIVERRLHAECAARGPQFLRDVHRAVESEVVVAHERQRAVGLLVRAVALVPRRCRAL